jgi:hypothetical protein
MSEALQRACMTFARRDAYTRGDGGRYDSPDDYARSNWKAYLGDMTEAFDAAGVTIPAPAVDEAQARRLLSGAELLDIMARKARGIARAADILGVATEDELKEAAVYEQLAEDIRALVGEAA